MNLTVRGLTPFLSSNAQDFIEELDLCHQRGRRAKFLSSNAQDFIEDSRNSACSCFVTWIPEQ